MDWIGESEWREQERNRMNEEMDEGRKQRNERNKERKKKTNASVGEEWMMIQWLWCAASGEDEEGDRYNWPLPPPPLLLLHCCLVAR